MMAFLGSFRLILSAPFSQFFVANKTFFWFKGMSGSLSRISGLSSQSCFGQAAAAENEKEPDVACATAAEASARSLCIATGMMISAVTSLSSIAHLGGIKQCKCRANLEESPLQ